MNKKDRNMPYTQINDTEIQKLYAQIKSNWEKYLKQCGVVLPNLTIASKFTKDALVLIYLYKKMGVAVSKTELTEFIKSYDPSVNDVQQARHLAQQKGWYILSGTRGDIIAKEQDIAPGNYKLITINEPYPSFTHERRSFSETGDSWEQIKTKYNYRCATCGSKEGEPNFHYPGCITKLQKGHKDPTKALTIDNIIPQCEKCNRPDRNNFVYDDKGRPIKIANPKIVLRSSPTIQYEIYKLLDKKSIKKK